MRTIFSNNNNRSNTRNHTHTHSLDSQVFNAFIDKIIKFIDANILCAMKQIELKASRLPKVSRFMEM